MRKATRRAGKVAPAVALAGALAAATQLHSLATAGPAAVIDPGAVSAHPIRRDLAAGTGTYASAYRLHRARTAQGHGPASADKVPARSSRGNSASASGSPGHRRPKAAASTGAGAGAGAGQHSTVSCSGTAGMLPANYAAIVDYLTVHGYTGIAAAGIAGNIYQESKGNPESVGSGGGGLIGWTPLPAGFVTGNPAADLQTQLAAILTYNQQWSAYVPALNAATSATEAADIYMNDFERPGLPEAGNREAAANAVAAACGL
jgi:hypothetical protein